MRNFAMGATLLVAALLGACTDGAPDIAAPPPDALQASLVASGDFCGDATTTALLAGRTANAGSVTVQNDDESVTVTLATTGGWTLSRSHVAIATSLDGIPVNNAGNPVPGRFPLQATHDPGTTSHGYTVSLASLGAAAGDALFIAAHAGVASGSRREGAWGDGERFSPRGNWATYFGHEVNACAGEQVFDFTGAEQEFVVPAGVRLITIEAFGAQGGQGGDDGPDGANGGSVTATVAVEPGEVLAVFVGGQGEGGVTGGHGGFNGGGTGSVGEMATAGSGGGGGGGGGGGASDVRRRGNGLDKRIVVAGAGGGSGRGSFAGTGGAGGDLTGASGRDGPAGSGGGGGGTQTAGGAGGAAGDAGSAGSAGTLGTGGGHVALHFGAGGAGGGGAGYFGGGSGGMSGDSGGGGGGGSSFTVPGATGITHAQGVRAGNGQVVITW